MTPEELFESLFEGKEGEVFCLMTKLANFDSIFNLVGDCLHPSQCAALKAIQQLVGEGVKFYQATSMQIPFLVVMTEELQERIAGLVYAIDDLIDSSEWRVISDEAITGWTATLTLRTNAASAAHYARMKIGSNGKYGQSLMEIDSSLPVAGFTSRQHEYEVLLALLVDKHHEFWHRDHRRNVAKFVLNPL